MASSRSLESRQTEACRLIQEIHEIPDADWRQVRLAVERFHNQFPDRFLELPVAGGLPCLIFNEFRTNIGKRCEFLRAYVPNCVPPKDLQPQTHHLKKLVRLFNEGLDHRHRIEARDFAFLFFDKFLSTSTALGHLLKLRLEVAHPADLPIESISERFATYVCEQTKYTRTMINMGLSNKPTLYLRQFCKQLLEEEGTSEVTSDITSDIKAEDAEVGRVIDLDSSIDLSQTFNSGPAGSESSLSILSGMSDTPGTGSDRFESSIPDPTRLEVSPATPCDSPYAGRRKSFTRLPTSGPSQSRKRVRLDDDHAGEDKELFRKAVENCVQVAQDQDPATSEQAKSFMEQVLDNFEIERVAIDKAKRDKQKAVELAEENERAAIKTARAKRRATIHESITSFGSFLQQRGDEIREKVQQERDNARREMKAIEARYLDEECTGTDQENLEALMRAINKKSLGGWSDEEFKDYGKYTQLVVAPRVPREGHVPADRAEKSHAEVEKAFAEVEDSTRGI